VGLQQYVIVKETRPRTLKDKLCNKYRK